jgi:LPS sulfotransferase NodH
VTQRFEQLLADVAEDPVVSAAYAVAARAVERDYLILFNGRSGSTWLTALLTGRLGVPEEYLNPEFLTHVARAVGSTSREGLLTGLRGRTNAGGAFGVEATSEHLAIFGEDTFFAHFPRLVVFNLWRDNLVAQAVSLFRAVETGRYHSGDEARLADPRYDGYKLGQWFLYLAHIENENFALLARFGLTATPLVYETMVVDPEGTLDTFYRALALDRPADVDSAARALPDRLAVGDWAAEVERRFRADHPDTVAEAYARRLAPPLDRVGG